MAVRYRSGTKTFNDALPEERTVPDRRRRCYRTVPDRRQQTSNRGHMRESAIADEPTFDSWSLGRYWIRKGFFWTNRFQGVGRVINGGRDKTVPADSPAQEKGPYIQPGKAQGKIGTDISKEKIF
ncbi:hypothetical protein L3X38_027010 [Prunus dulcis]|uniref:Uncharacterized protein n=1 Tax=Prunus dulcis TaxID=3755 RepID=A0AAD4VM49_PRUDU|nr:hypothetical protein L3X38_027010 [Prunus dulcis]